MENSTNRPIDHLIFKDTDELEEFIHRAIERQSEDYLECSYCKNLCHKSDIKSFDGIYYVCKEDWTENERRVKLEIQAIYIDSGDVVPYSKINDFFNGYWEV